MPASRFGRFVLSCFRILLAAVSASLCLAMPADAQPDTTRWTPELGLQYRDVTGIDLSPDGRHVAYVVREAVMDETTSEYRQHIHVARADGSFDLQYTYGEHSDWSPKWSPAGDRLAFLSARDGPTQVYLMRLRGGEAFQVTDAETGVSGFEWGPGGERIAFTMTDPKSEAETRGEREKRDVEVVDEEHRTDHLYVTALGRAGDTTRQVQRLTDGNYHVMSVDWAPDGSTLAIGHVDPREREARGSISVVPADSGERTPLVDDLAVDGGPLFSPDGERVAFTADGPERRPGVAEVYTVPASGGDAAALPQTPNRSSRLIGWTADGRTLLVSDVAGTSTHVFALPMGGGPAEQVTSGDGVRGYVMYGAVPSYSSAAGRLAVTFEDADTPVEVYVGPLQDFTRRQVTSVNEEAPRPEMGRTELVSWTSPDGTEIEGLLTYPVGYEEGARVPLVLDVHGGPLAAHVRTFTGRPYMYLIQLFAEHGYAILRPNPRGSSGYGKAFRDRVIEDWGPGPLEDLMAGVDRAIEMGVAHPDSLTIMGMSYGGYMTAYAVTQTDRFQAASMAAGISNLVSMVGTSDLPGLLIDLMAGEYWERPETYDQNAPIRHVEQVTTPTQVLHGAEDERVPPSQGREFYRALDRLGIETEMVVYPRTPHGPDEPKLLMDWTRRPLDWFDEHLGRGGGEAPVASPTRR